MDVFGDNLALSSDLKILVVAPVSVANSEFSLGAAFANKASVGLDHEVSLIDGFGILLLLFFEGLLNFDLVEISSRVLATFNQGVFFDCAL